jgi:hypothetical protein
MQARKPDGLRDAEARVHALTFEVGTLREEIKRECKRRERAVLRAKEADAAREAAQHQVNELRWAGAASARGDSLSAGMPPGPRPARGQAGAVPGARLEAAVCLGGTLGGWSVGPGAGSLWLQPRPPSPPLHRDRASAGAAATAADSCCNP